MLFNIHYKKNVLLHKTFASGTSLKGKVIICFFICLSVFGKFNTSPGNKNFENFASGDLTQKIKIPVFQGLRLRPICCIYLVLIIFLLFRHLHSKVCFMHYQFSLSILVFVLCSFLEKFLDFFI